MATQFHQKVMSSKIKLLSEQKNLLDEIKDNLQTCVDDTNKVLGLATSWLKNDDDAKDYTFAELNKIIDDKIVFLLSSNELFGSYEMTKVNDESSTRCLPPSSASSDQHIQTLDKLNAVVQETMSFLKSNLEMFSEKQSAMERFIEGLSEKYMKKEEELEAQLSQAVDKQKTTTIQQEARIQNCERIMQVVSDAKTDIDESWQLLTHKLNDVQEIIHQFNTRINQVLENQAIAKTQFESIGNRLTVLEANTELSNKKKECALLLEEPAKNVDETEVKCLLGAQGNETEVKCLLGAQGNETEVKCLLGAQGNESEVKCLLGAQGNESEKEKLDERMTTLETSRSESLYEVVDCHKDVEKKNEVMVAEVKLNFLLLGKTGNGKSATGNTLLNRPVFKTSSFASSETKNVDFNFSQFGKYTLLVVDGPGLEDTFVNSAEDKIAAAENMNKALAMCYGGVDAFLFVVRFGTRFTSEEEMVIEVLKNIFGGEFINHVIVVMTYGDHFFQLEDFDLSFHDWCKQQRGPLRAFFKNVNERFVLFNNRERDEVKKQAQVHEVVKIAECLQKHGGRYNSQCFENARREREKMIIEMRAPQLREEIQKHICLLTAEIEDMADRPSDYMKKKIRDRAQQLRSEINKIDMNYGALKELLDMVDEVEMNLNDSQKLKAVAKRSRRSHIKGPCVLS